jgi:hypothetical protein
LPLIGGAYFAARTKQLALRCMFNATRCEAPGLHS